MENGERPAGQVLEILVCLLIPLFVTACGDVACVQNPVGPERAVELARKYLLSHSIAEFEHGPPYLKRFSAALRESGLNEAGIAKLAASAPKFR